MTPHGTLQDMADVEALANAEALAQISLGPKHREIWALSRDLLKRAVHFEFGDAAPMTEHVDFGFNLLDQNMFRLPYQVVFCTSRAFPKRALLTTFYAATERLDLRWATIAFSPICLSRTQPRAFMLPALAITTYGPSWEQARVSWSVSQILARRTRPTGQPLTDNDWMVGCWNAQSFVAGATGMLKSKDIEVIREPAPVRLNKARALKGRLPIGERHIVRVKLEHRRAYAEAADAHREGRASPRMHLRRGHFRLVREGLIVPVAPSIINAGDGAKPTAKVYQVQT